LIGWRLLVGIELRVLICRRRQSNRYIAGRSGDKTEGTNPVTGFNYFPSHCHCFTHSNYLRVECKTTAFVLSQDFSRFCARIAKTSRIIFDWEECRVQPFSQRKSPLAMANGLKNLHSFF
jgi:hypothetical protein